MGGFSDGSAALDKRGPPPCPYGDRIGGGGPVNRPAAILAFLAALAGAAGVALGAAGAHLPGGGDFTRLGAIYVVAHAATVMGAAAFARLAYFSRSLLLIGIVMLAGATLFAADLAFHDFYGTRLFPFAAPIGGT